MNQSESIAELSAALAKAQGIMEGASKDSANPFFKSKYADLASVWDACRKPLSDNGLSVVQTTEFMPEHPDMVCIETILCHASGQWIKGRLAVKPVKSDPQSVGSCITYLRRYSLQSIVGIAPEDDDGNAASGKNDTKKQPEATTAPVEEVPPQANVASHEANIEAPKQSTDAKPNMITEAQRKRFYAIAKGSGKSDADIKKWLLEINGNESTAAIEKAKYEYFCTEIGKKDAA
jgi:hypothetical protein